MFFEIMIMRIIQIKIRTSIKRIRYAKIKVLNPKRLLPRRTLEKRKKSVASADSKE